MKYRAKQNIAPGSKEGESHEEGHSIHLLREYSFNLFFRSPTHSSNEIFSPNCVSSVVLSPQNSKMTETVPDLKELIQKQNE